ncbi:transposase [Mycobacterium avium]|uniref:transposase n=1 Tax=Mycobacterium avium TaxID=1764 RepID=UPI00373FD6E4
MKSRGLAGVQLVISDAHAGLRSAIDAVLIGAAWQRCRGRHTESADHPTAGPGRPRPRCRGLCRSG